MNYFNKEEFAGLLKEAQGGRSINQYALQSNVSAAHISRLLRGLLDEPPEAKTIKKLADKAHGGISYYDLMRACGHLQSEKGVAQDSQTSQAEALDARNIGLPDPLYMKLAQEAQKMELTEDDVEFLIDLYKRLKPSN